MHLRKLVLACGFASFALSNYASALGLGEVKLKSTLNQPLSAEVQLLDTKGLSPEQIIVSLASSAEFERNGLDFVHFYTEFRFEVALDNPGGPVVRISSRNPVREPYLNFLIEAKWTSGRLLREYTLLMDLPTFDDGAPQAVQAPKAAPAEVTSSARETQSTVEAPVAQVSAAGNSDLDEPEEKPDIIAEQDQIEKKSRTVAGTYGPVGDRDTLWDIALSVRPDSSASVHQTMLALQRLNPDAFIRGNINLLKKGQVLRVPDANEIASVSKSEAVRQFNEQTAEWSGAATSASNTALGAQLDASRRTTSERVKSEAVAGRVKLEAPTSGEKTAGGQGSGANKGSGRALESELAATLEELDRAKSEKTELSSRVHALEDQVKTMQRLVDVSNEKLRAMQLNAGKQPDPAAKDTKVAEADKADAGTAEPTTSQASISTAAATQTASSAAAVMPKKPVAKPAPKVVEPEKTLVDHLIDNILWVGLGVAALLGLGALAVARRRKAQAEAEQQAAESDELFTAEPDFGNFNQAQEDAVPVEPSADEMSLFDEEASTAVAETGDVVGEADIYIAYGKYDQAEEMLVNALAKDPASVDIRLKLLEVYSHTRQATEFDKHYAAILPLATGFALSRARELRANIPDIGEFSAESAQVAAEETGFDKDFNLDDFDIESRQDTAPPADEHVDFNLDLDDTGDLKSSATNYGMDFSEESDSTSPSLDDEFALDLDLDDLADERHASKAEDLSDISLALDGLDDHKLPEDVEVSSRDDEFNFDFDEPDSASNSLTETTDSMASSSFNEDLLADDFNLEMDVNKVDLAALDNEMASFDADLDALDEDLDALNLPSTPADNKLAEEFDIDALDASTPLEEFGANDEFDVDLDESELTATELDELESLDAESDADESGFTWEEDEEADAEESAYLLADESLAVDNEDGFDPDVSVEFEEDDEFDLAATENSPAGADIAEDIQDVDELSDLDISGYETGQESVAVTPEELASLDNIDEEAVEEIAAVAESASEPLADTLSDELSDDDVFEQALSDFSAENLAMDDAESMSEDDMDAELDFMADADEAATKLDLARAYIDMGDNEGARDILAEVAHEGNEQQRQEAVDLLSRIDA